MIIISVYLVVGASWLMWYSQHLAPNKPYWETDIHETNISDVLYNDETQISLVKYDKEMKGTSNSDVMSTSYESGEMLISDGQLVVPRYSLARLSNDEGIIRDGNNRLKTTYFYIDLFQLKGDKLGEKKTIDVKKLINQYNDKLEPLKLLDVFTKNKQVIVKIKVYHKIKNDWDDQILYMNTATIDFFKSGEFEEEQLDTRIETGIVLATNVFKTLEKRGINSELSSGKNIFTIREYYTDYRKETREVKREKDWKSLPFLTLYPETRSFFEVKTGKTESKLFLPKTLNGQQIIDLLWPPNIDLYDNVFLEKYYSVDGEDHLFSSYEEFNSLYKYSPENYEATIKKEQEEQEEQAE